MWRADPGLRGKGELTLEPALLRKLNQLRSSRQAAIVASWHDRGETMLIGEGEEVDGSLETAIAEAFQSGKSGFRQLEDGEVFLNVYLPPPRLMVIGAVHISQALVPMAKAAGYDLTIIDPRTAFATPERFPGVRLLSEWPQEVLADAPLDRHSALAAITHDPKIDDLPLSKALHAGCFYVGALGSRKTHAKRVERLAAQGLSEKEIGRIHAPIGLDIGAATPAEIAVAILAEVISCYRRRKV